MRRSQGVSQAADRVGESPAESVGAPYRAPRRRSRRLILTMAAVDLSFTGLAVVAMLALGSWGAMPSDVGPHVHTSPAHVRLDGGRMGR